MSRVGTIELIVRRPTQGEREVLAEATLDVEHGLVGDNWKARGSRHTPDGSADPERQLTFMSVEAVTRFAGPDRADWPTAGDQLYVDLDVSEAALPPGTQLTLGDGGAVIEVSSVPHTGCAKFTQRFGLDAIRAVKSAEGLSLRWRGVNAKVVQGGVIRVGDRITALD